MVGHCDVVMEIIILWWTTQAIQVFSGVDNIMIKMVIIIRRGYEWPTTRLLGIWPMELPPAPPPHALSCGRGWMGGWLLIKWADNKHVIGGNAIVKYSITILSATNRDSQWIIKWMAGWVSEWVLLINCIFSGRSELMAHTAIHGKCPLGCPKLTYQCRASTISLYCYRGVVE